MPDLCYILTGVEIGSQELTSPKTYLFARRSSLSHCFGELPVLAWIASYPRSGNTFFRYALQHMHGIRSYAGIAAVDLVEKGEVRETNRGTSGIFEPPPLGTRQELAETSEWFFVKTHHLPQDDSLPAVYLVRDGRDALVSYAHYVLRIERQMPTYGAELFQSTLYDLILEDRSPFGTWKTNVETWTARPNTHVIRFEDLVRHPGSCVSKSLDRFGLKLPPAKGTPPTFEELHAISPSFFRRGCIGGWVDEFPAELLDRFYQRFGSTLARLGYHATARDE